MKKLLTLALVTDRERVLLGMKKRGFGVGQWNGFGGKVEVGESLYEAAAREVKEEVGVVPQEMEEVGVLNFSFRDVDMELEVHVYRVDSWEGEPEETDEMRPEWLSFDIVPYDRMWPDDIHWLPLLLAGKRFKGEFHFDRPSDTEYRSEVLIAEVRER